ncbi:glucagon receptor isoform X3 [Latimeria chalumnae]|uniref:glucagon receptor isoform X3 n=1 Tax=Latimeria chalumnae TaxID=7897 RepID=UPI0003C175E8|nr:PREDICTED: gastric inhibitory polypeptide receptor isoform X3 [Latimeria chalumnae]|eukprot:XP_014341377.1 PREDICTED: gastric inhibitory polypeptide receptor isoform X3 [Latimeria chalumnae]
MVELPRTFLLAVLLLSHAESIAGKTAQDMFQEWKRYEKECEQKMATDPYPTGLFCNRTFDMYVCWPDGPPNTTVKVPCPWFLPWQEKVQNGSVFRKCGPGGHWVTDSSGLPWRDHSQCGYVDEEIQIQKKVKILDHFRVMYTVGYSLSLAALVLALITLLAFRKLRCTRNYIHMNLFASFILRAISILMRDALLKTHIKQEIKNEGDIFNLLSDQAAVGCRLAQVLMQYCVGANYYWLLVEGLYLHNLLVVMVLSEKSYFRGYLLIGWGAPVLFVVPWVLVRYFHENTQLAKSTLTLIPLLGIHKLVFEFVTEEQAKGTLRYVKLFFELFLNSFQGLLVAILYCFVNKEVQSEISKKWQRRKLGMSLLEENRHTCSNAPQGQGTGSGHRHHRPGSSCKACQREKNGKLSNDSNYSSENSSSGHHHSGAKNSKSFCYISTKKLPPATNHTDRVMGEKPLVKVSESYC